MNPMRQVITRAADSAPEVVSKARRQVRGVVNSDHVDRHGTVLDPAGIDTEDYMRNPVLIYHHAQDPRYGSLPVGRCLELELRQRVERGTRRTHLEGLFRIRDDPESDRIWQSICDGTMRGFSVNCVPHECSPPSRAELDARPDLSRVSAIYRSMSLLEISVTPLPSNPHTVVQEVYRAAPDLSPAMARELVRAVHRHDRARRERIAREVGAELPALVERELRRGLR